MRKGYLAVVILVAVNLAMTAAFVAFMPDQVPAHFNASGEVDRIGSRYEGFVMPLLALVLGIFLALVSKYGEPDNRGLMTRLNIMLQVFLIGMGVFIFWNQISYDGASVSSGSGGVDILKITGIGLGILFVILGFMMPKAPMNGVFGLRVPWTMDSEESWRKGQRFGGAVSIWAGLLMVLCGVVLSGLAASIAMTAAFVAWVLVSLIGSYYLCRRSEI